MQEAFLFAKTYVLSMHARLQFWGGDSPLYLYPPLTISSLGYYQMLDRLIAVKNCCNSAVRGLVQNRMFKS